MSLQLLHTWPSWCDRIFKEECFFFWPISYFNKRNARNITWWYLQGSTWFLLFIQGIDWNRCYSVHFEVTQVSLVNIISHFSWWFLRQKIFFPLKTTLVIDHKYVNYLLGYFNSSSPPSYMTPGKMACIVNKIKRIGHKSKWPKLSHNQLQGALILPEFDWLIQVHAKTAFILCSFSTCCFWSRFYHCSYACSIDRREL